MSIEPDQRPGDGTGGPPAKPSVVKRATAYADRQKTRAGELRKEAEARRPRSAVLDVGFIAVEHDGQVGGGILAGAVAFRIFLFVVPLVFVLVAGFGLAADASDHSASDLASSAGIAGLLATTITTVDGQSFGTRLTIFLAGGFALALGARTLLLVLNAVHILVWRLPRTKVRHPAKATSGLVLVTLLGMVFVRGLSWLRDQSFVVAVAGTLLSLIVATVMWTWASLKVFPHLPGVQATDVLPGALLIAVGFEAMRLFTIIYVSRSFEKKSETYGAVGGSLALLLWAYVLGRIITGAVVLNAAFWERRQRLQPAPAAPASLPPPAAGWLPPPPSIDPPAPLPPPPGPA